MTESAVLFALQCGLLVLMLLITRDDELRDFVLLLALICYRRLLSDCSGLMLLQSVLIDLLNSHDSVNTLGLSHVMRGFVKVAELVTFDFYLISQCQDQCLVFLSVLGASASLLD